MTSHPYEESEVTALLCFFLPPAPDWIRFKRLFEFLNLIQNRVIITATLQRRAQIS
jgi:hypothetical protein